MANVSVAKAKRHLSELITRSAHGHERFIITRRGQSVAVLVSLQNLAIIEQHAEHEGLATLVGQWSDFEELAQSIENPNELGRLERPGREVSL